MSTVPGASSAESVRTGIAIWGVLALLSVPLAAGASPAAAALIAAIVVWLIVARHLLLQWKSLLTFLLAVIAFIPIGRYALPSGLPFELEPYRVVVALLVVCWGSSLLIDPRVRLRRSGLEGPLGLFALAALASVVANGGRIDAQALGSHVFKALSFFASFVLVFYMIVSIGRSRAMVNRVLAFLVAAGVVIALAAIFESRSGFNVFSHLKVPGLHPVYENTEAPRGGRYRAQGPAEHPIALSALLAMLVPIAAYFAYITKARRWWLAAAALAAGSMATVSRTGILMLLVEGVILLILRPVQIKRLWPMLLPLVVAVHFVLPGTLGTLKDSFFPKGGLVAEQQGYQKTGRLGDWPPTLRQVAKEPLFGIGYGTRITNGRGYNARILDDEWLATLLSTGIVGLTAWVWLFVRTVRRLVRRARRGTDGDAWLAAALAAALAGFAFGMWTYDAFSFTQSTFVFYIFLAISSVVLSREPGIDVPRLRSAKVGT